jgi:hypothetical protein
VKKLIAVATVSAIALVIIPLAASNVEGPREEILPRLAMDVEGPREEKLPTLFGALINWDQERPDVA